MTTNDTSRPEDYLAEVSVQVNKLIIGNEKNKNKFRKHISKVVKEFEKHMRYLRAKYEKAKKTGLTIYDKNKNNDKRWSLWNARADDFYPGNIYFADDNEWLKVYFYIEGKLKPDPLDYLRSMILGSVGQVYEGLEVLDYQYLLLAIIHDARNWQAGRESIYFNSRERKTLSDRLCRATSGRLENKFRQNPYGFNDVLETIATALLAVKANLPEKPAKQKPPAASGGTADLPNEKKEETGQNAVLAKVRKLWNLVRRIPRWIYILVLFLAALLGILEKLGCLEPVKAFISKMLSSK